MKITRTNLIELKSEHMFLRELNDYEIKISDGYNSIQLIQLWLDELIELLQAYKKEKNEGN